MSEQRERLHSIVDDLRGADIFAAEAMQGYLAETRDSREEKVAILADDFSAIDLVSQLFAATVLKELLKTRIATGIAEQEEQPEVGAVGWVYNRILSNPHFYQYAPGVYWAYGNYHNAVRSTGEFSSYFDFQLARETLCFPENKEMYGVNPERKVTDFLLSWWAARNPESKAAKLVSEKVHKSGRVSISHQSQWVLFHESVLDEYIRVECRYGQQTRTAIDPIITLAATDDIDFALSQMSRHAVRRFDKNN